MIKLRFSRRGCASNSAQVAEGQLFEHGSRFGLAQNLRNNRIWYVTGFLRLAIAMLATIGLQVDSYAAQSGGTKIDAYYNEDYDNLLPQLSGFDLRVSQIGMTRCVPTFLEKFPKSVYLVKGKDGLAIGDLNPYRSTHCNLCIVGSSCIGVDKALVAFLFGENVSRPANAKTAIIDKIIEAGGHCRRVKSSMKCSHSIVISRIFRDHFTGKQLGGEYFILIAFNIFFPAKSVEIKPEQIRIEWFQGNPPRGF